MKPDDVRLINNFLLLIAPAQIDKLEQELGTRLPNGYREFITTFGIGIYSDTVRIYSPARILRESAEFRERWNEYYFWEASKDILTKQQVLESVTIGDTVNGDEFIFHPSEPDKILILPIDFEEIFVAGSHLDDAIEWVCASGVLFEAVNDRYFEPFPLADADQG